MMKKLLIALLISGLVLTGAGAVVYAQTEQSPVCPPENNIFEVLGMTANEVHDAYRNGKTMKDLFDAKGLDYDSYISEMTENSLACVVEALANGEITEEQASRLSTAIQNFADKGFPFNMNFRFLANIKAHQIRNRSLDNLASVLGLETGELVNAFKTGSTFGQIAEQQGMDPGTVFEEWIHSQIEDINQAVDDGKLNSDRANLLIEKLNEKLTDGFDIENWTPFDNLPGPGMKIRFLTGKDLLGTVLDAFGMTNEEFRAAIKDGQTLEEISAKKGVDLDELYQTWIKDQINVVNEKLTNEEITQKQADALLDKLNDQLGEPFPENFLRRTYRGFQNFREKQFQGLKRFGGFWDKGFPDGSSLPKGPEPGASF